MRQVTASLASAHMLTYILHAQTHIKHPNNAINPHVCARVSVGICDDDDDGGQKNMRGPTPDSIAGVLSPAAAPKTDYTRPARSGRSPSTAAESRSNFNGIPFAYEALLLLRVS